MNRFLLRQRSLINNRLSVTVEVNKFLMLGIGFARAEEWEYGDYGQCYGCDEYYDCEIRALCFALHLRWWIL